MLYLIPAYMVIFAILNRTAGRDRLWPGNGRNIYYVAPVGAGVAFILSGGNAAFAVAVLLAWLLYRIPGWFALNDLGRNNPGYFENPKAEVRKDFLLMVLRQSWFAMPLGFWAYYYTSASITDILITVVSCGVLGALGYLFGHISWKRGRAEKPGRVAELAAGAALGFITYFFYTFTFT